MRAAIDEPGVSRVHKKGLRLFLLSIEPYKSYTLKKERCFIGKGGFYVPGEGCRSTGLSARLLGFSGCGDEPFCSCQKVAVDSASILEIK